MQNTHVNRADDPIGTQIRTFQAPEGDQVQAVALVDELGVQSGVADNPLDVGGQALLDIVTTLLNKATQLNSDHVILEDIDMLMRNLLNNPLVRTPVDSYGRPRVAVDTLASTTQSASIANANIPVVGAPAIGTAYWTYAWIGPVDQRWEIIQRSNIEYSEAQRNRMTFS